MVCEFVSVLGSNLTIGDYLVFPITCYYYFYAWMLLVFFISLSAGLWYRERALYVQPNMISCMAVSATATVFIALLGTLVRSSNNIAMISSDIFASCIALWIIISVFWLWLD